VKGMLLKGKRAVFEGERGSLMNHQGLSSRQPLFVIQKHYELLFSEQDLLKLLLSPFPLAKIRGKIETCNT
jgi:hypothetical protein